MRKYMGPTGASYKPRQFPTWPFAIFESRLFWLAVAGVILLIGLR